MSFYEKAKATQDHYGIKESVEGDNLDGLTDQEKLHVQKSNMYDELMEVLTTISKNTNSPVNDKALVNFILKSTNSSIKSNGARNMASSLSRIAIHLAGGNSN